MEKYRIEHDSLGEVKVPAKADWGAQTERSRHNFTTGPQMPVNIIRALIAIKAAAARANKAAQRLDSAKADLIIEVCQKLEAENDEELMTRFPLHIYQTGSGTQTNMNVNEVISHLAHKINPDELVHPNDHVNMAQSSNDTFPTAIQVASYLAVRRLMKVLDKVEETLSKKEKEYWKTVKIGRTHLQDAVPLTFGQEVSGWRSALAHSSIALQNNLELLRELPIGGTAVGTELNAPAGFSDAVAKNLSADFDADFVSAPNKFQGLANHTGIDIVHGILKSLAADLVKIGNDIRFLASGPRAGYGELTIPANEPGSSIMPGKVNPTQIEALTMAAARVMGNDTTITFAASQGNFEMNVYKPVIAAAFLESTDLLSGCMQSFNDRCLSGMKVNQKRMAELVDNSLMLVTALSPHIGYEKSAQIALKAQKEGWSLKYAALKSGFLSAEEYTEWIDPLKMTRA